MSRKGEPDRQIPLERSQKVRNRGKNGKTNLPLGIYDILRASLNRHFFDPSMNIGDCVPNDVGEDVGTLDK